MATTFKDTMKELGIKDEKTLRDFLSNADYSIRGTKRAVKGFNKLKDSNQYEFTEGGFRVRTPEGMAASSGKGRGNLKGRDIGDLIGLGRDISTLAGALNVGRNQFSAKKAAEEAQTQAAQKTAVAAAQTNLTGMRSALSDAPVSTQPEPPAAPASGDKNKGGSGGGKEDGKTTTTPPVAPPATPPPIVNAPSGSGIDSSIFMPQRKPYQEGSGLASVKSTTPQYVGGGPEIDLGRVMRDMGIDTSRLGALEFLVGPQQAAPVSIPNLRPALKNVAGKVAGKLDDAARWVWGEKGFNPAAWRKAQDALQKTGAAVKTTPLNTTSANTLRNVGKSTLSPAKFNAEVNAMVARNPKVKSGILSNGTRVRLVGGNWQIYREGGKLMAKGGSMSSKINAAGGVTPYIRGLQLDLNGVLVSDPRTGEQVSYWDLKNSFLRDPDKERINKILLQNNLPQNYQGREMYLNMIGEQNLKKLNRDVPKTEKTVTTNEAQESWRWGDELDGGNFKAYGGKLRQMDNGGITRRGVSSQMTLPGLLAKPQGVTLKTLETPVFMTEDDLYGQYDANRDAGTEMGFQGDPGDSNLNLNDLLYLGSGVGSSAYALARANKFSKRRGDAVPTYMKPQFQVGAVRDIVKPRYAKYYTPTGSDLNSEMRSKSFADAMQSEMDYGYEMNRDASRMQQEEMVRDRQNKVAETEANLVNRERDMRANLNLQDYLYGRGLMDEGVIGLSDNVANFASQSAYRDAGERAAAAKYLAETGQTDMFDKLFPRIYRQMRKTRGQ